MKRFVIFSGDEYYPRGGWEDFVGSTDTLSEAMDHEAEGRDPRRINGYWSHIVDMETQTIVDSFNPLY